MLTGGSPFFRMGRAFVHSGITRQSSEGTCWLAYFHTAGYVFFRPFRSDRAITSAMAAWRFS